MSDPCYLYKLAKMCDLRPTPSAGCVEKARRKLTDGLLDWHKQHTSSLDSDVTTKPVYATNPEELAKPFRQDQTVKHDPPNAYGDCFRTTVANILGLKVEEVPHVLHDACEMDEANRRMNTFLRQYGLAFVQMDMGKDFDKLIGLEGLWHEGSGDTERGTYHAAMFFDGELSHDPHPSHAGFTKTSTVRGVFVSLRPWEVVASKKAVKP